MNTPLILENSSKPQFMSTKGRIGRVRLLAWTLSLALATIAGMLVLAWLASTVVRDLSGLLLIAGLVIAQILSMLLIIRRLHDLNRSGWFCLLVLVPWFGYVFILLLMLVPGNRCSNRFGPVPAPNSIGERILACLWPVLILGFIGVAALKSAF
ncbi:DUF805 domain-containing protein [Pseudomonas tussilaginis]|uniref:DUF805 domain-containing protein n=1 Tax=Pseudomonas sp. 5 TaxID=1619949 RepID=UPI0006987469|nr:DUF805 domain-containing protein [Pseudomonas sp. 5]